MPWHVAGERGRRPAPAVMPMTVSSSLHSRNHSTRVSSTFVWLERVPLTTEEVSCRATRARRYHVPRHVRKGVPHESSRDCAGPIRSPGPRRLTAAGFWSLTKYDDVLYASRHTELFSSRLGIRMEDMDAEETEARRTMMEMDSPEHTRLRRIVARPFTRAPWPTTRRVRELAREVSPPRRRRRVRFRQGRRSRTPMKMLGRLSSAQRGPRLARESR